MADMIEELINQGSVDPAELARQLRRENEYGKIGALSGSSRLAPFAQATTDNAVGQAQGIGDRRTAAYNTEMKNSLEQWKAEMAAAAKRSELQARREEGAANRANLRDIAGARIGSAEKIAKARLDKAGGGNVAMDPQAMQDQAMELGRLADTAEQAKSQSGYFNTGWRSLAAGVGGPGADLSKKLIVLQANQALTALQELRRQSKTGASGLGVASDRDIELLQSKVANLDQIQSAKQLDEALDTIGSLYRRLSKRMLEQAHGASFNQGADQQMTEDELLDADLSSDGNEGF